MRSLGVALLAACGATTPTTTTSPAPIAEHEGARPAIDMRAIAGLPHAIDGLQSFPIDMGARTDRLLGAASYNVPCTDAIAREVTGYYWPMLDDTSDIGMPQLITGTLTLDELVACMQKLEGGERLPTEDHSIVALDTDHAFLALPTGGILVARRADELAPLAGAVTDATARLPGARAGANPLAALVDPPSTAEWSVVARDFTWELLGVESLGAIFEYDRSLEPGPIAIRVRFHDGAAATLARERFDHPDDVVSRSALGEPVAAALGLIRRRGTITVEGRDVVIRGRISESDWRDNPLGIFDSLAIAVGHADADDAPVERILLRRR